MTNKQALEKLRSALQEAAPSDLEAVLSQCQEQKASVVPMKKKNVKIFAAVAAAAACLAVAVGFGGYYTTNNFVDSQVSLDVNPSVQLNLNKKERVVETQALNEDAKAIMDGMDLKGVQAEVAVNALIGSMVKNGYLTQDANSVLISVQNKDAAVADQLKEKLGSAVSESLAQDDLQGSVITQVVEENAQLAQEAERYGISQGKVQYARQIAGQNQNLTVEQLAKTPVNDLNLLASSKKNTTDATTSGQVSDGKYIGKDAAVNAAMNHAGIASAVGAKAEFDMENGKMVYDVEFYANGQKYEYDVDASSGAVLKNYTKPAGDMSSMIGEKAAANAAVAHAGVDAAAVTRLTVTLDDERGKMVYDVDFVVDKMKYDYTIDAASGAVLKGEKEIADQEDLTGIDTPDGDDLLDDLDDIYDRDDKHDLDDVYDDVDDPYDDLDDLYDKDDDLDDLHEIQRMAGNSAIQGMPNLDADDLDDLYDRDDDYDDDDYDD